MVRSRANVTTTSGIQGDGETTNNTNTTTIHKSPTQPYTIHDPPPRISDPAYLHPPTNPRTLATTNPPHHSRITISDTTLGTKSYLLRRLQRVNR